MLEKLIVYGFVISFTKWDFINKPTWVGLENYMSILADKESTYHRQFWDGFGNTFKFVLLNVPVSIVFPLFLATLLNIKPKGSRLFQSILYIPTLFSVSAVGIIWMQMLNKRYGLVSLFNVKCSIATTDRSVSVQRNAEFPFRRAYMSSLQARTMKHLPK